MQETRLFAWMLSLTMILGLIALIVCMLGGK